MSSVIKTIVDKLPSISLLRDLRNQNSSERFAKDFRQSYISIPYMEVFDFTASKHLPYKVWTCIIDGNLLQTAQRSFDFEGHVAVKLTVSEAHVNKRVTHYLLE